MSLKSILSLLAVVVVVGGAWYYWGRSSVPSQQVAMQDQAQRVGPVPTLPAAQDDTQIQAGTSLEADLNAIDSQAAAAGDASASANSSDTPVAQTE